MKDDRFPSAWQTFFLLLALFLAEYLVGAALYDVQHTLDLSSSELDVFVTLLGNGLVFSVLMHMKGMSYRNLFHPSNASVRATTVLLVPPVLLLIPAMVLVAGQVVDLLVRLLPLSSWEEQAFSQMAGHNLPSMLATCLLAPVLEEMLFRGIILRAFLNQYHRPQAIFGSAVFFGLAHLNIYQFAVAFMLGSVAGWLYERSRSLIPCIALHAVYNTSLVVLGLTLDANADNTSAWATFGTSVLALAAAAWGVYLLRRLLERRATQVRA